MILLCDAGPVVVHRTEFSTERGWVQGDSDQWSVRGIRSNTHEPRINRRTTPLEIETARLQPICW